MQVHTVTQGYAEGWDAQWSGLGVGVGLSMVFGVGRSDSDMLYLVATHYHLESTLLHPDAFMALAQRISSSHAIHVRISCHLASADIVAATPRT